MFKDVLFFEPYSFDQTACFVGGQIPEAKGNTTYVLKPVVNPFREIGVEETSRLKEKVSPVKCGPTCPIQAGVRYAHFS